MTTLLTREERCIAQRQRGGKEGNITTQPIFSSTHRQSPGLGSQVPSIFSLAKEKRDWDLQNDLSWQEPLEVTQSKPHSVTPGSHVVLTVPMEGNPATSQGPCCSVWPSSQQELLLSIYSVSCVVFCHFTAHLPKECDSSTSTSSHQKAIGSNNTILYPPFLEAGQAQFPQPLLIHLLQSPDHLGGSPPHSFLYLTYFLYRGTQNWTQHCKYSQVLLATLLLMQSRTWLAFFARRAHCGLRFNLSTSICRALSDFPARQCPTCTSTQGYSTLEKGLYICLALTSWCSCLPFLQPAQALLVYCPLPTVWFHPQTCQSHTPSYHPRG